MSIDADRLNVQPLISLPLMVKVAESLGCWLEFLRVDFYDAGVIPRFGE